MPILEDDKMQIAGDRLVNYVGGGDPSVKFGDKVTSAFRLGNAIISKFAETDGLPDGYAETDYDVFSKLTDSEKKNESFVRMAALSDNDDELGSVREQYQQEMADRENLTGVDGVVAGLLAGTFDPVNLIPVGGAASKLYRGGSVLKNGLAIGAVTAGSVGVSELLLHESQLTRTGEESLFNVTGSMILGGILGSGATAIGNIKMNQYAKDIEQILGEPAVNTVVKDGPVGGDSAGAMSVFGEVKVKGKYVEMALKALSPIDPLARVMTSASKSARKYGALLAENPLEIEGISGRSIEQSAKTKQAMYMGRALNEHLSIFTEAKKNGYKGKRSDFNVLVSREMANPNSTGNVFAHKSAESWNSKLYTPMQKELQESGLLGDDLDVKTAARYLNRRWNKEVVAAKMPEFKRVVSKWLQETQPDIEDADDLAGQIASRIMGTPDGVIKYDAVIGGSSRPVTKKELNVDTEKLKGIEVDEKVSIKETGEVKKVKADAADVYNRLTKQKKMLTILRGCINA